MTIANDWQKGYIGILLITLLTSTGSVWAKEKGTNSSNLNILPYSVPSLSLKIKEPPSPFSLKTYQEGIYQVHIYQRPDFSRVNPKNRSVLLLGMFSSEGSVEEATNLKNPATKQPYDVIIGVMPELPKMQTPPATGSSIASENAAHSSLSDKITALPGQLKEAVSTKIRDVVHEAAGLPVEHEEQSSDTSSGVVESLRNKAHETAQEIHSNAVQAVNKGIGYAEDLTEGVRAVMDHLDPMSNMQAVKKAIHEQFGGPLEAKTMDLHSNGTPIGIASLKDGHVFSGVQVVNAMGPDIGVGGQHLNQESLQKLEQAGVKEVNVYRNMGDIVPELGTYSENLKKAVMEAGGNSTDVAGINHLAIKLTEEVIQNQAELSTVGGSGDLPGDLKFQYYQLPPVAEGIENHYVNHYVDLRAEGNLSQRAFPGDSVEMAVGGVKIAIDDQMLLKLLQEGNPEEISQSLGMLTDGLSSTHSPEEQQAAMEKFIKALGGEYKATQAQRKLQNLVAVSLSALLQQAQTYQSNWQALPEPLKYPGHMSRIRGFMEDADHQNLVLIGETAPEGPYLNLDDLTVGIRTAFIQKATPACSLDPKPENTGGPQYSMIQGVPKDSDFAKTMLDADYDMKKLSIAKDHLDLPSFKPFTAAVAEQGNVDPSGGARFWFYPVQPQPGSIQLSGTRDTALFISHMQVLSENLIHTEQGIFGAGNALGASEETASSFTRNLDAIMVQRPNIHKLEGLFDIVMLSSLLRTMGIQLPVIQGFADLPYQSETVPEYYEGLTNTDSGITLHGGVQIQQPGSKRAILLLDETQMATLRKQAQAASVSGQVATPLNGLQISVVDLERASDELSLKKTLMIHRISQGQLGKEGVLLKELNGLLQKYPNDAELLIMRSLYHLQDNTLSLAEIDALRAREIDGENPVTASKAAIILGSIYSIQGKFEQAHAALDSALKLDENNALLLALQGSVYQDQQNISQARAMLTQAIQKDPGSGLAYAIRADLEAQQGWVSRANEFAQKAYQLSPDSIDAKLTLASTELYLTHFSDARKRLTEILENPAAMPIIKVQAYLDFAAMAGMQQDWSAFHQNLDQAIAITPNNVLPLTSGAEMALKFGNIPLATQYAQRAKAMAPQSPLVLSVLQKLQ